MQQIANPNKNNSKQKKIKKKERKKRNKGKIWTKKLNLSQERPSTMTNNFHHA